MDVSRRDLFKGSAAVVLTGAMSRVGLAADDPLPSWTEGPAKRALLDFVHATTDPQRATFVPQAKRIASFLRLAKRKIPK